MEDKNLYDKGSRMELYHPTLLLFLANDFISLNLFNFNRLHS